MKINQEIRDILHRYGIAQDDGLSYLVSVYYDIKPSYTPIILVQKIQRTGILTLDEKTKTIDWAVALFDEQITGFAWVKDWIQLFVEKNKDRKGTLADVTKRMKQFFVDHIDENILKDEVMEATKMYLRTVSSPQFVKTTQKFILEGVGKNSYSLLMEWIEKYREANMSEDSDYSLNTKMQ